MKTGCLLFFVLFCSPLIRAQKITISGYLRDAENNEALIGANIFEKNKKFGTVSNNYGFFSLTIEPDSLELIFSYVGYQPQPVKLNLVKDTLVLVRLKGVELNEVVVRGDRTEKIQESTRMSTFSIPVDQIKRLPVLMGETDVIKIIQLLPGVQGGSEGSSGLYVRGGGPDQNLILLDGVPLYNVSHLYGFFSVFNADAINHIELVKGGFPARYGGRLSSVLDISMKEGNSGEFHGQASLGAVASKLMFEGPIIKNKTSFIVSARRSYLNLLKSWLLDQSTADISNYYFYDMNAKVNHIINPNNRVYLSFYSGKDVANTDSKDHYKNSDYQYQTTRNSKLNWGNTITALRWNHIFNKKLFANITGSFTQYHFQVYNHTATSNYTIATGIRENQFYTYNYNSGIQDYAARVDFDFIPNPKHYVRTGFNFINHSFTPGVIAIKSSGSIEPPASANKGIPANELAAYLEDDWEITGKLKANVGVYATTFLVEGTSYPSLQPRVSIRYLVSKDWSLKASYAKMQQNMHLLTNAGIGLPTDLWVPATGLIRPQTSHQGALGLAYNFKNKYEISIESYYKSMQNLIEYKHGANYLDVNQDWQTKVTAGKGESYGTEFFVQKKVGKISGWLGYTLSWNYRQFADLNNGKTFPYRYDRRHDAKVTVSYQHDEHFNFGLTWLYGTGNAVTVPLVAYHVGRTTVEAIQSGDAPLWYYEGRNNFRMAAYHRMDLNANYSVLKKWGEHRFTLSVYNAYARRNPFYLQMGSDNDGRAFLMQVSLFSIVPSLYYSIIF